MYGSRDQKMLINNLKLQRLHNLISILDHCQICKEVFWQSKDKCHHNDENSRKFFNQNKDHQALLKKYKCDYCKKLFIAENSLQYHHRNCSKKRIYEENLQRARAQAQAQAEAQAQARAQAQAQTQAHAQAQAQAQAQDQAYSQTQTVQTCELCGRKFFYLPNLKSHIENVHQRHSYINYNWTRPSDYKTFNIKCRKCNLKFKHQESLDIHMKETHSQCQSTYISGKEHPKLRASIGVLKDYSCDVCKYSTPIRSNLSIHMKSNKHFRNMQRFKNDGPALARLSNFVENEFN